MTDYLLDFETKSSLPISAGTERYLRTAQSDIVCMSWCTLTSPVKIWVPGQPVPFKPTEEDTLLAFNAQFDERVWNYLGVPRYGLTSHNITRWVDIMAIAGRYGYPQKLSILGKVLKLRIQKDPKGKALMKKICQPPFKYTVEDLKSFLRYCITDTASMREALFKLPSNRLSEDEQAVWLMTVDLNRRGLPVDKISVARILIEINRDKAKAEEDLSEVTDGAITTFGQTARIRNYCLSYDVDMPNLRAETVSAYLDAGGLPKEVEYILRQRQMYGLSSVAKYKRLLEQIYKGRVYDNLRYYGGHTGRWAGLGFQAHNLPRGKKGLDYNLLIERILERRVRNVLGAAKTLIRPMVKSPKNRKLVVADYKGIENILLAFVAGEMWVLDLYREGKDEYKDMATKLYTIDYEEVDGEQRNTCKPIVLGAGYGLGGGGLLGYAEGYGVDLSRSESDLAIRVYRETHPNVVNLWYGAHRAFENAILYPGTEFKYETVRFKMVQDRAGTKWMRMTLPSLRTMFYCEPKIINGLYGETISSMAIDSKTKQWVRREISPGHLTENIIQASARDILVFGKFNLLEAGYKLLLSVHDEVIIEVIDGFSDLEHVYSTMCRLPLWATGLPLFAEGKIVERYQKI